MNIKRYAGPKMFLGDLPEIVRVAYAASMHRTVSFYGDTVDTQMTLGRTRLCEATADYLYTKHTPLKILYKRGMRPELEKTVARILKGKRSERARVLALLRFVRDLYTLYPEVRAKGELDSFHGGLEEEVIKKGSSMCNEQSRVFCCLCQVAGIPARYVGHHVGGHGVMEAFVEGAWAYFDNRGKYFLKSNGKLASAWEIRNDLSLIDSQPDEVKADVRPGVSDDTTRVYFSRVEITSVMNYFVWDCAKYDFGWIWNTPDLRARIIEVRKEFPAELSHVNILAMVRGEKPWPPLSLSGRGSG